MLKDLIMRPRGLVLVTGPTGSGKTTTLAATIDYLNDNVDHHIITIEDPIEFYHPHKKSTVNQREIGVDVPSFAEAIRRALRQDPDVILVGEMRDLETIEAAITAAETGHIVFGTLHTTGAQGTVNRIIDVFPTNQQEQIRTQLSTSVIGILSQALLPKIGGGRVAAYEMLVVTPAIANLIRENKTFRITSAIQTGQKLGMQLLDDHMFKLWRQGLVEKKEILFRANNPDDLAARIAKAERGHLRRRGQTRGVSGDVEATSSEPVSSGARHAAGDLQRDRRLHGNSAHRTNPGRPGVPHRRAVGDAAGGAAAAARRAVRPDRHRAWA